MSLLTYNDARPWAKAIKVAVVTKKMPPWFADPNYGHFANDSRLLESEKKLIGDWIDNGSPEGDPKDLPAPVRFEEGWRIKPDLVISIPKPYQVPAHGDVAYEYVGWRLRNFGHGITCR